MLKSMTAFARSEHVAEWGSLQWELRSVNNRYFDIGLRLPEELRRIEGAVRERVRARVSRGKVDVMLKLGLGATGSTQMDIDTDRVQALMGAAREVAREVGEDQRFALQPLEVLRWPGVVRSPQLDLDAVAAAALEALGSALDELVSTRQREGEKLAQLIVERCDQMDELTQRIRQRLPLVVTDARERLRTRLAELRASVDEGRLEQEIVMFAQRMDSAEELDRLDAHVGEARRVLGANGPNGRRLDFLAQELNRESNTIASKSSDAEVTRDAVAVKVLVEQIREQVQNIE